MTKFEQLLDEIIEIIEWAEEQKHIKEDAATILIRNIKEAAEEIEKN